MNPDEIILFIFLRQSTQMSSNQIACCTASAVQHLLIKYFASMLIATKLKNSSLAQDPRILTTTNWLSSNALKDLKSVDDKIFESLKKEFIVGKELFVLKEFGNEENVLFLFPQKLSTIPKHIQDLPKII